MVEYYWITWIWAVIAAPFVGSFLAVLALRLPAGMPVVFARSACPHCGHRLSAADLTPLIGWLANGGKCRYCVGPIAVFYPAVELGALGVAVWAAWVLPGPLLVWAGCLLGWALLGAAIFDAREYLLPDILILPLVPAGILLHVWIAPEQWPGHVAGAAIGFALFAGIAMVYRRFRGRDGLGIGDAKLLAAAGAWVGWFGLPSVILLAAIFGFLTALLLRLAGRHINKVTELPFGPGLAVAFWLVWLYGPLVPV